MTVRVLSVCSGIGAPECAWSPLGWEFVAHAEIEPFPSAVLAHHYPGVPNWGDMTKFSEWPDADVDVLVGGTPCQSFSVAGLRKGLADPRGNLALTFLAIADRFRPDWVVWENVPGVLSSAGGRDFGAFLGGLGELGYGWAYRVLDAQYFGLAQRRKRVFVVASARGWASAAAVLFERESLSGHPAPSREAGEGTAGCAGRSTESSGAVAGTLSANGKAAGSATSQDAEAGLQVAHTLRAEGFDASEDGAGRGTPLVPISFTGGASDILSEIDMAQPITGRHGDPGMVATNATATGVRRILPVEAEKLQGFPPGWTAILYRGKPAADGPRYRALGNSMAVPCMAWIGRRIQMVDDLIRALRASEAA